AAIDAGGGDSHEELPVERTVPRGKGRFHLPDLFGILDNHAHLNNHCTDIMRPDSCAQTVWRREPRRRRYRTFMLGHVFRICLILIAAAVWPTAAHADPADIDAAARGVV